jgi:hypothetical protein
MAKSLRSGCCIVEGQRNDADCVGRSKDDESLVGLSSTFHSLGMGSAGTGSGRKKPPFSVFLGDWRIFEKRDSRPPLFTSTAPPGSIGGPVNSETCSARHKFNSGPPNIAFSVPDSAAAACGCYSNPSPHMIFTFIHAPCLETYLIVKIRNSCSR